MAEAGVPGSPTGGVAGAGGGSSSGTAGSPSAGTDGVSGDAGNTAGDNAGGAGGSGVVTPPSVCVTSADGPVAGGARLKAICVVSAADGSQILRRGKLFDSKLGAECSYRAAADGSWRCLPTLHQRAEIMSKVGFADASCTQRVTWFDEPSSGCALDVPQYVYQLDAAPYCGYQDGREHHTHVFRLGSLIAQPMPLYSKSGTDCTVVPAPLNSVYYTVDAELPASDFVAGVQAVKP